MTFTEAIKEMECGAMVRRACDGWNNKFIRLSSDGDFRDDNGQLYMAGYAATQATDWEIYNPEPALNPCGCGGRAIYAIKEDAGRLQHAVECPACGCRTAMCFTRQVATDCWNRAHPLPCPKPRTNFEARFVPWTEANQSWGLCSYKSRFILDPRNFTCSSISCEECNKLFIKHLQEEYKEEEQ